MYCTDTVHLRIASDSDGDSLVTAIFELGAVLGALQSAVLAEKLSRRRTIFVATFWYLLGSVLQAGRSFSMLGLITVMQVAR